MKYNGGFGCHTAGATRAGGSGTTPLDAKRAELARARCVARRAIGAASAA